MLRAYALMYAVVVALMIALFSSGVLYMIYLNNTVSYFDQSRIYHRQLLQDGMSVLLEIYKGYPYDKEIGYNLYGEEKSKIVFQNKQWGLYDVLTVKTDQENPLHLYGIIGQNTEKNYSDALYLADRLKPLIVSGTTLVVGDITIPKSGIQQGYVDGRPFLGTKLLDGKVRYGRNKLPDINLQRINAQYTINISEPMSEFETDSINNSFGKEPLVFLLDDAVRIQNIKISGNVIIFSKHKIQISNTVHLNDVIIVAPVIELEKNMSGSVQLFATDTIVIGEKAVLSYPSALVLKNNSGKGYIKASRDSKIEGEIYYISDETQDLLSQGNISVEESALVKGFVYCDGNMDLRGKIFGTVHTQEFVLVTSQTRYANYLNNTVIDVKKRHASFLFSGACILNTKSDVIKWLN